ncbi:MAG: sigma-70 family RNA polymerase sigma factor [Clostridia bacterium]|nr:sigma-70 family RNA polymerase sigma factor [Clostridia bacterium]
MQDADIVELYWARNQSAVTATYEKYYSYCRRIALNVLRSEEDAEECVNDVWYAAWETIPPAKPELLSAYLAKITRNLALKRVRDESRQKRGGEAEKLPFEELADFIADGTSVEETAEASELGAALNRFLAELPEEQRKIFMRRYWYGDSIEDIAARGGFTESKVKMTFLRLRDKLRDRLRGEGVRDE